MRDLLKQISMLAEDGRANYLLAGNCCGDIINLLRDAQEVLPSAEFSGCKAKEVLAKLLYPDVESVDAYECGGCKEEFSIGTKPNNCPRCGVKFTRVGVF